MIPDTFNTLVARGRIAPSIADDKCVRCESRRRWLSNMLGRGVHGASHLALPCWWRWNRNCSDWNVAYKLV